MPRRRLGWLAGSIILGVYLYVSLNRFGRHANEAFSALAIPDWKNFLPLHIDEPPIVVPAQKT